MSRRADEIRDEMLDEMRLAFEARGQRAEVTERSLLWVIASAVALELEGIEAQAEAAGLEAFPSSASDEGVLRHVDASGLDRVQPSRAVLRVRVQGPPSSYGLGVPAGRQLTDAQGQLFDEATEGEYLSFDAAGFGWMKVVAHRAGAAGNLDAGAVLRWQGAPVGMGPTAVVGAGPGDTSHLLVLGSDLESMASLRSRAVAWRRERAHAGNRADWHGWGKAVEGVGDFFVWPRTFAAPGRAWRSNQPGVVTTVPLAAVPPEDSYVQRPDGLAGLGLAPTYSRVPSDALCQRVRRSIEGTHDAGGRPLPSALQRPLRPVGLAAENYLVRAPDVRVVDVTVALATDPAVAPWPWSATAPSVRQVMAATASALTLDNAVGIVPGTRLAVEVGLGVVRGGFWLATVATVVGDVVTLARPLPAVPVVGAEVRPDCGLWDATRALVLRVFDQLGPGDAPTDDSADGVHIFSQRYPRPTDQCPDRLFTSMLVAPVQRLAGVVGVEVLDVEAGPGTSTAPSPLLLLVPGMVRVRRSG